jgi:hypothetical protein
MGKVTGSDFDFFATLQTGLNFDETEGTSFTAESGVAPSVFLDSRQILSVSGQVAGGVTHGDWRASFTPTLSVGIFGKVGLSAGPRLSYNFGTDDTELGATACFGTLRLNDGKGLPTGIVVSLNDFANRSEDRLTVSFVLAAKLN